MFSAIVCGQTAEIEIERLEERPGGDEECRKGGTVGKEFDNEDRPRPRPPVGERVCGWKVYHLGFQHYRYPASRRALLVHRS